jgi:hypothetical protein
MWYSLYQSINNNGVFEEIPQINVHGREKSYQRLILSPASQNMHHTGL